MTSRVAAHLKMGSLDYMECKYLYLYEIFDEFEESWGESSSRGIERRNNIGIWSAGGSGAGGDFFYRIISCLLCQPVIL